MTILCRKFNLSVIRVIHVTRGKESPVGTDSTHLSMRPIASALSQRYIDGEMANAPETVDPPTGPGFQYDCSNGSLMHTEDDQLATGVGSCPEADIEGGR